jgi:hypothetical protein
MKVEVINIDMYVTCFIKRLYDRNKNVELNIIFNEVHTASERLECIVGLLPIAL